MARKGVAAEGLLPGPIHSEVGSVQNHKSQEGDEGKGLLGIENQRHQIFPDSLSLHVATDHLPERRERRLQETPISCSGERYSLRVPGSTWLVQTVERIFLMLLSPLLGRATVMALLIFSF